MHNFNPYIKQQGVAAALLLIAVLGLLAFFAVSSLAPFKNNRLSTLFPKEESQAAPIAGFTQTTVASSLNQPTAFEFSPDGRIFYNDKTGKIMIIKNGQKLTTPFADLSANVNFQDERGLLGIALDPNFATNQYVYVFYTSQTPAVHNRVSRFTANGDVAVPGSETVIFDMTNLGTAGNHNGGAIHFGPDGKLYISHGENATSSNAQRVDNHLGKILRINPDGTIPSDNPTSFKNSSGTIMTTSGNNRAIWAIGLRNPFTFGIHPVSGKMYINDVGASTFEEVNPGIAGANYGWPACEGGCTNPNFVNPAYFYGRTVGYAIAGGAFYNHTKFGSNYTNQYLFGEFGNDWIKIVHQLKSKLIKNKLSRKNN